ncbi:MAG: AhpC/TSA family protein, partial [Alistipes sp.]|nr:AhpC/TSA family protein [Alistipes sp.]
YHDKGFEIYGISFDKNRDAWLAAVADKQMTWLHVSDLTGFDNQAARDYAVQGIPSNFLVETASGTIVATNLRGEALGEKIAELLD